MPHCSVYGCHNEAKKTKGTGIKYYSFPKDERFRQEWIKSCHRKDKFNIQNARICSIHFPPDCFIVSLRHKLLDYSPSNTRNIKPDAIPTVNLPVPMKKVSERPTEHEARSNTQARKATVEDLLSEDQNKDPVDFSVEMLSSTSSISDTHQEKNITYASVDALSNAYDEIAILQEKLAEMEIENKQLREENSRIRAESKEEITKLLSNYFTPGQIQKISNPNKLVRWGTADISSAISLRAVTPKGYRYMRQIGYPLPALSTLRRWALSLDLKPGILSDVIKLMSEKAKCFDERERITALSFDEIYISNKICIESKNQQVVGPHKTCQVIFARGLMSQWKQPIFFMYDQPMTKDIIYNIISELYKVGFIVASITSDMGNTNQALWSKLNVGHDKECFFTHPRNETLKIFVFADAPHLLKLARNHMLDSGFNHNGKFINKSCLEKLISASTDDLKIAHKISRYHLGVRGSERQKVRPAAQIFSATTAKAIEWCGQKGFLGDSNWQETSYAFKLINDWFDVFNSRAKYGSHPGLNGFGVDIENQVEILNAMSRFISEIIVGKHSKMIPFQKGILLNNSSLIQLHNHLNSLYGFDYVITYRLNQDIVENFFSYTRGMGATNDHPTPLDFKYRLRWYILGKHSAAIFTDNKNTEEDAGEACLVRPLDCSSEEISCLSQTLFKNIIETSNENPENSNEDNDLNLIGSYSFIEIENEDEVESQIVHDEFSISPELENLLTDYEHATHFSETISQEGLKYLAGYIAYRFQHKYPEIELGKHTHLLKSNNKEAPDWIEFLSRGHLMYPSDNLLLVTKVLNEQFELFHKKSLSKEPMIFDKVADLTLSALPEDLKLPREIILCLSRTRSYIRLREINKKQSFENCQRKLKKKLSKVTNNPINKFK